MDFKDVKDFLNRDVRDLFGTRPSPSGPMLEARCAEASLELRSRDEGLVVLCRLDRAPLFSLPAQLAGPLSVVPSASADRAPATTVRVPLALGEATSTLTLQHRVVRTDSVSDEVDWVLVESRTEGPERLHFVFERSGERAVFEFTLPSGLTPSEVRPGPAREARYAPLPTVAQMSALLRTMLAGLEGAPRLAGGSRAETSRAETGLERLGSLPLGPGPHRILPVLACWRGRPETAAEPHPPGLDELLLLLDGAGCTVAPDTIRLLCLYVEIEMERVTPERLRSWFEGSPLPALSPYTVDAVAGAVDVPLIALSQAPEELAVPRVRQALAAISAGGLLIGMHSGEEVVFCHWAPGRDPGGLFADALTGDVLLSPAVLEHVRDVDLSLFLSAGLPIYACFQSDLDRRRVWRRLEGPVAADRQSFEFVDGFRVYHFQSCVLAKLVEGGESATMRVARDDRGSLHYMAREAALPGGLEETALSLCLPPADGLPAILREMGEERRRGRVEGLSVEVRKLDLLSHVLPRMLSRRDRYRNLAARSEDLKSLRATLTAASTASSLGGLVDARTLDELTAMLTAEPPSLAPWLYEPLAGLLRRPGVAHAAVMALVLEMCSSDRVHLKSGFKNYNRARFPSTLLDDWMQMVESQDADVRRAGCLLLGTSAHLAASRERTVVAYALNRALEVSTGDAAREAASAILRLALEEYLPPARLWNLEASAEVARPAASAASTRLASEGGRVLDEMRAFLSRVSTCLLGSAGASTAPGPLRGLASLVAGARAAWPDLPGGAVAHDRLAVTTARALETLLKRLLEGWRAFRRESEHQADEVVVVKTCRSFLGDAGRFGMLTDLEHGPEQGGLPWVSWPSSEVVEPSPFWMHRASDAGGTVTSPFFSSLLSRALSEGADHLRLVCFHREDDLLALHVLHPLRGRFLPFLELMRPASASFLDETELASLEDLIERTEVEEAGDEEILREHDDSDALKAVVAALRDGRAVSPVLEAFQLGEEYRRQVLMILEAACGRYEGTRP